MKKSIEILRRINLIHTWRNSIHVSSEKFLHEVEQILKPVIEHFETHTVTVYYLAAWTGAADPKTCKIYVFHGNIFCQVYNKSARKTHI